MRGHARARAESRGAPARLRALVAVAAVVVSLGAQLAGFAHLALVSHEPCAEHGELVHRDPSTPPGAPDAEGHDHCLLAGHATPAVVVQGPAKALAPLSARVAPRVALLPEPPPSPIAIRFLAPKQSPPA
jgi:hypothetical protein